MRIKGSNKLELETIVFYFKYCDEIIFYGIIPKQGRTSITFNKHFRPSLK